MSDPEADLFSSIQPSARSGSRVTPPRWSWILLTGAGAVVLLAAYLGFGNKPTTNFDLTRHSVPLDQIVDGGPGKDGIPAILNPRFVSATDTTFDPRYHPKEWVVGIELNGVARAYPFAELKKAPSLLRDQIGDRQVTVHFNEISRSASVTDAEGNPIPSVMAFWFAWYSFHPDTEVFTRR